MEEEIEIDYSCGWSRGQHVAHGLVIAAIAGGVGYLLGQHVMHKKNSLYISELESIVDDYVDYAESAKEEFDQRLLNYQDLAELYQKGEPPFDGGVDKPSERQLKIVEALSEVDQEKSVRPPTYSSPEEAYRDLHPEDTTAGTELLDLDDIDADTLEAQMHREQFPEDYGPGGVTARSSDAVAFVPHIPEDDDPTWTWAKELEYREQLEDGEPYVVHVEEYMSNEDSYDQINMTYFAGDGVLVDDKDEPVHLVDPIIGRHTLGRFGDGSGNPDTVFVRNDRMETEFEITRDRGKYAHEILRLEHMDRPPRHRRVRKPRELE